MLPVIVPMVLIVLAAIFLSGCGELSPAGSSITNSYNTTIVGANEGSAKEMVLTMAVSTNTIDEVSTYYAQASWTAYYAGADEAGTVYEFMENDNVLFATAERQISFDIEAEGETKYQVRLRDNTTKTSNSYDFNFE